MSIAQRDPQLAAWLDGHEAELSSARAEALMRGVQARLMAEEGALWPGFLARWAAGGTLGLATAAGVALGVLAAPAPDVPSLLLGLLTGFGS